MPTSRPVRSPASARLVRSAGAPPGPRKYGARRDALLDAATSLFVEKGMSNATIDDIVAQAGVAKGTFYHYFRDRAAMLDALRDRYSDQFLASTDRAMAACAAGDWSARLAAWFGAVMAGYLATYALHDVLFHELAVRRQAMGEVPIVLQLAALLADGAAAGKWAVDDPVATAVVMFHAMHGAVDEAIVTGADPAGVTPRVVRLLERMIRRD